MLLFETLFKYSFLSILNEDQMHNLCHSSLAVHPGSEAPALPSLVSSKSGKLVLFISVSLVDRLPDTELEFMSVYGVN